MLKIGITGVHGFVGSSLYVYLKDRGYDVTGFSRRKDDSEYLYWDIAKGPLKSPPHLDVIVHCAGTVDDWATHEECYVNNCKGTQDVIDSFPQLKKCIYISSCSVYDSQDASKLIDERSPCGNFLNGYSQSKYEAEQIVLNHTSKFQKIILRPHVIYGKLDKKIIPRLLKAHKFSRFIVIGKGKNTISITHIDNLCLAIKNSIEIHFDNDKEIFNITDKDALTMDELITHVKQKFSIEAKNLYIPRPVAYGIGFVCEMIFRILKIKRAPLITRYIVHQMSSDHAISIKKANTMLQYVPSASISNF